MIQLKYQNKRGNTVLHRSGAADIFIFSFQRYNYNFITVESAKLTLILHAILSS